MNQLEPDRIGPAVLRKPMARATRVSLIQKKIERALPLSALELLLSSVEVLSEGEPKAGAMGRSTYYGSTMFTLDLEQTESIVQERCDARTAEEIARLLEHDDRACGWFRRVADQQARRRAGAPLRRISIELAFRTEAASVFVDADVEGGF